MQALYFESLLVHTYCLQLVEYNITFTRVRWRRNYTLSQMSTTLQAFKLFFFSK